MADVGRLDEIKQRATIRPSHRDPFVMDRDIAWLLAENERLQATIATRGKAIEWWVAEAKKDARCREVIRVDPDGYEARCSGLAGHGGTHGFIGVVDPDAQFERAGVSSEVDT